MDGDDDFMLNKTIPGLDYHTASYWVQVLQIPVYALALVYLARVVFTGRGVVHAGRIAAKNV